MKIMIPKNTLMKLFTLICFIFLIKLNAQNCAQYYNPTRFFNAPDALKEILSSNKYSKKFTIERKELYKYEALMIAEEINDDFGGFWSDYIGEDGYEMLLIPEYNLFHYKDKYFSLKITIYGVKGDATNYKTTIVKYHFYDYTNEVLKYKKCERENS